MLTRCQCREIWAPFLCRDFAPRPAPTTPADLRYAPHCGRGGGIGAPCPPRAETPSQRPNRAPAGRFVAFPPRVSPRPPTAPLSPVPRHLQSRFAALRAHYGVSARSRSARRRARLLPSGPACLSIRAAPSPMPARRSALRAALRAGQGHRRAVPTQRRNTQPAP